MRLTIITEKGDISAELTGKAAERVAKNLLTMQGEFKTVTLGKERKSVRRFISNENAILRFGDVAVNLWENYMVNIHE